MSGTTTQTTTQQSTRIANAAPYLFLYSYVHTYIRHSKIEFTAWERKDFDRCDTAEGSPHFGTPTVTHLDSMGRAFLAVADDGVSHDIRTRTVLDIEGNERKIIDARGNAVMEYKYGIHGEKGYTNSMDAGERWMLLAADGQPVYEWDARGHRITKSLSES